MIYSKPKLFFVAAASLLIAACSETDSGPTAEQSAETAHEAALQELETQPVTELDPVHLPEQLLDTYHQTCGTCHERGVINAPKTGDTAAWSPRLAKGMDTLVTHARDGFKAMPPAGLCYGCSEEDLALLIRYMSAPQTSSEALQ